MDVEDEVGAGGDGAGEATRGEVLVLFYKHTRRGLDGERGGGLPVAVGVVGGDVQSSLLADLHGDNALVPALDDASDTDGGVEVALSDGGVEAGGGC